MAKPIIFKSREKAIAWIIDWKDMSHPNEFLDSSLKCGYIQIEGEESHEEG